MSQSHEASTRSPPAASVSPPVVVEHHKALSQTDWPSFREMGGLQVSFLPGLAVKSEVTSWKMWKAACSCTRRKPFPPCSPPLATVKSLESCSCRAFSRLPLVFFCPKFSLPCIRWWHVLCRMFIYRIQQLAGKKKKEKKKKIVLFGLLVIQGLPYLLCSNTHLLTVQLMIHVLCECMHWERHKYQILSNPQK